METLDKKLTIHEEFAYLRATTDLMNKWRGNKHMKGKENPPDSIFFFFSRGEIEMAISSSVFSLKGLEFLSKCDLASQWDFSKDWC